MFNILIIARLFSLFKWIFILLFIKIKKILEFKNAWRKRFFRLFICTFSMFLIFSNAYSFEFAIQPSFDSAGHFNEGAAPVYLNDKWGLIGRKGRWLVEPKYAAIKKGSEGLFAFMINDKWGFLNSAGKVQVEPRFSKVRNFSDGYAAVKSGRYWGFIDRSGRSITNDEFEIVSDIVDGVVAVVEANSTLVSLRFLEEFSIKNEFWDAGYIYGVEFNIEGKDFSSDDGGRLSVQNTIGAFKLKLNTNFLILGKGRESIIFGHQGNFIKDVVVIDDRNFFNIDLSLGTAGGVLVGRHDFSHSGMPVCENFSMKKSYMYDAGIYERLRLFVGEKADALKSSYISSLNACDGEFAVLGPFVRIRTSDAPYLSIDSDLDKTSGLGLWSDDPENIESGSLDVDSLNLQALYGFSEGFALYKSNEGKFGYMKLNGSHASSYISAVFDDGFAVREGTAPVLYKNKWGYLKLGDQVKLSVRRPILIEAK